MRQTELPTGQRLLVIALVFLMTVSAWGCGGRGTEIDQGVQALGNYGCSSCHSIPGVHRADGVVGPPLDFWAERWYIAGAMLNTPDNLILWLMDPQAIEPGTAMPRMGVTGTDAGNIGAFLYTLEGGDRGHVSVRGHTADMNIPLLHSGAP
jgi:cytochrome c